MGEDGEQGARAGGRAGLWRNDRGGGGGVAPAAVRWEGGAGGGRRSAGDLALLPYDAHALPIRSPLAPSCSAWHCAGRKRGCADRVARTGSHGSRIGRIEDGTARVGSGRLWMGLLGLGIGGDGSEGRIGGDGSGIAWIGLLGPDRMYPAQTNRTARIGPHGSDRTNRAARILGSARIGIGTDRAARIGPHGRDSGGARVFIAQVDAGGVICEDCGEIGQLCL